MTVVDGYSNSKLELESRFQAQSSLNKRLETIAKELKVLPTLPYSMDRWINSIVDPNKKTFSLQEYKKHLSYKKEYEEILDKSDSNLREVKILLIEEIIGKINSTLKQ